MIEYDYSYTPIFTTNDETVADTLNSLKEGWCDTISGMKANDNNKKKDFATIEKEAMEKVFGKYSKYIKEFDNGKHFSYSVLPFILK